jgi:hypothetical protein
VSESARPRKASGGVLDVWLVRCGSERANHGMMRSCPAGIEPLLRSEWTDPAVVRVDCALRHAIAVTGGHHDANEIAARLEVLGADPVITNASEVVKCGGSGRGRCSRNIA